MEKRERKTVRNPLDHFEFTVFEIALCSLPHKFLMPSKASKAPPKKATSRPPRPPPMAPRPPPMATRELGVESESEDSGSETDEEEGFVIVKAADVEQESSFTSGLSSQTSQSQSTPGSSLATPRSSEGSQSLVTPRSSKSSSRAPPQMIILNDKYTPVPIEKFNYDDTIATGLDEFEPYKPLVDSKYFTSVKVWVLLHRGEEMLVELKDCTRHLRLIHQVMIIFNTLTTTANCRLLL